MPSINTNKYWLVSISALLWTLFQLWYASPLPFALNVGIFNDTQARAIHLAFALFLVFLIYPQKKQTSSKGFSFPRLILASGAAFCSLYLLLFHEGLADRAGAPIQQDVIVAAVGMILLLEATRRTLGLPLVVVASVFLFYSFAGPYMPEVIAHKGVSLNKLMSHQWLGTEGVFGVALGVSTGFVFLFVLFGAMLDKAGAGKFFIELAFSLLGHLRGGPAKAAVVASGLSGVISGSSIANVVTTGTFTIPLMKRVGFPATKAAAIEVAASTNGQLMPPIMGAAAFLMVEYVGISYLEVIRHAILPALISYIALLYIVHLEAVKAGMKGLPPRHSLSLSNRILMWLGLVVLLMLFSLVVYYALNWAKIWLGESLIYWLVGVLLLAYVALVAWSSAVPNVNQIATEGELDRIPPLGRTLRSGLYYLLPVLVLIWSLAVERLSPGLSAFWACMFMLLILLTQYPLRAFFLRENIASAIASGWSDLNSALRQGAYNMIGIGIATATAGIIVGTVTLTGIGLVMTEFVEFVSGGNLLVMLLFTALISLILGMGLPTTANYIVVSTLMAPVIVALGAQHGLVIPLIAVHMFVFYFGILADDTPPVGLAAFAAAGIAQADPLRTGLQGFAYDIRTAILPFMFIFNTELLLIDVTSWGHLFLVVISAVLAMLCFAAATQGFWFRKTRWWEIILLLLLTFSLFRPGFWWDKLYPPTKQVASTMINQVVEQIPDNGKLTLLVEGNTLEGDWVERKVVLPLGSRQSAQKRLEQTGLSLKMDVVDSIMYGSPAQEAGLDLDWKITGIIQRVDRPSKYWLLLPSLVLLMLMAWYQKRGGRYHESPDPVL